MKILLELEQDIEVVGEAAEAELALQRLETIRAEVVLMDVRLPGLNGIEATRLLKKNHPDIRVVILTFFGDEYLDAAIEAGATSYILKTSTGQQLVQAIRAARQDQVTLDPSLTQRVVIELAQLRKAQRDSMLTARQVEILKLVTEGSHYEEIAERLFVSIRTVNREMHDVFNLLGVNDAASAVSEAYKKRLI